jgi:hypothetical protein
MTKSTITSKCSSVTAHFESLTDTLVLCGVHCPMQHVQGYSRCPWTPPSCNYSLRIAPVVARATANKTMMKNVPAFLAILMAMAVHQ